MPSKYRGKELRKIIKKIRDRTFEYDNREPPVTDWTKYDQAQIHEMVTYLNDTRDLVDEADRRIKERTPKRKRGPGKPPTDPSDITKVLLLQTYTGSPNRVAEGLLLLFQEKLGIHDHFSYKTIERGYDRDAVDQILDEVTKIVNECVEGKEVTFSFDGTGFSASNKENYAAKRKEQNSKKKMKKNIDDSSDNPSDDLFPKSNATAKKSFTYSVMGVGVKYKLISGMSICHNNSIGETTMFPNAFTQTLSYHPNMEDTLGDGIYACRWITDLVTRNHANPYFLPRSNVTFKSKGYLGWHKMLLSLWRDSQEWMSVYHMRSISETVNSMVKCRFGDVLRKKIDSRKKTETKLKLIAHDIRRIGYLKILGKIEPHWPRKGVG